MVLATLTIRFSKWPFPSLVRTCHCRTVKCFACAIYKCGRATHRLQRKGCQRALSRRISESPQCVAFMLQDSSLSEEMHHFLKQGSVFAIAQYCLHLVNFHRFVSNAGGWQEGKLARKQNAVNKSGCGSPYNTSDFCRVSLHAMYSFQDDSHMPLLVNHMQHFLRKGTS